MPIRFQPSRQRKVQRDWSAIDLLKEPIYLVKGSFHSFRAHPRDQDRFRRCDRTLPDHRCCCFRFVPRRPMCLRRPDRDDCLGHSSPTHDRSRSSRCLYPSPFFQSRRFRQTHCPGDQEAKGYLRPGTAACWNATPQRRTSSIGKKLKGHPQCADLQTPRSMPRFTDTWQGDRHHVARYRIGSGVLHLNRARTREGDGAPPIERK